MKMINATTLRNNLAEALSLVEKKDFLLVAKRGKVTSALVDINLFEDLMALSNKDYLKSIRKARREYQKGDIFDSKQVFGKV